MSKWYKACIRFPIEDAYTLFWLRNQNTRVKIRERPSISVFRDNSGAIWTGKQGHSGGINWKRYTWQAPEYMCIKIKDPNIAFQFKLKYNGTVE